MKKENILGLHVCSIGKKELLQDIFADYNDNVQIVITSVNPEIVINNYKDKKFVESINSQKYQIPDGIGIIYASKINKGNIKNRIAGIDLMYDIIKKSTQLNSKIFLYGAKPGVALEAKKEIEKKYPNSNIIGVCDGYVCEEEAIRRINEANPDILFVGIGSPKQENFIINNKEYLKSVKIFMPVGGSFDVISNNLKRAPEWMIKMNIEWLYRLFQQPTRFFRQIKLVKFVFLVFIDKIRRKKGKEVDTECKK